MEKNTETTDSILSKVMNLNQQREKFYLQESCEVNDEALKELFRALALQSASFNQLLKNNITQPEINAHSTRISDGHEFKPSETLADIKSILAAGESLEAQAEKIYFEALSCTIPIDLCLRKLISNQHYEIKRTYKKIKELHNSLIHHLT